MINDELDDMYEKAIVQLDSDVTAANRRISDMFDSNQMTLDQLKEQIAEYERKYRFDRK